MSRTYSNFLLFEDVLDDMPEGSAIMKQAVKVLLSPMVPIVEEDCNTLLGKIVDTTFEIQGFVETATKEPLDQIRINQLLAAGQYKTGLRTLHTCQSYRYGGVCKLCYESNLFLRNTDVSVGSTITIPALQVYQTDILMGNGYTQTFPLSQTSDDWYQVVVINQGNVVDPSLYTLGDDSITFPSILGSDPITDVYNVHFLKQNSDPFLGYISKTYSGALLGILPLPAVELFLREPLYEALFPDNMVSLIMEEIANLRALPSTYKDYLERVHSKLEKVLLALFLYAIYGNVEV